MEEGEYEETEILAEVNSRAVSGGGSGSKKACRTCKRGISRDKKKQMFRFCRETHGRGRKNKDARRQCMRKAKKEECQEQCSFGSLIEDEDTKDEDAEGEEMEDEHEEMEEGEDEETEIEAGMNDRAVSG